MITAEEKSLILNLQPYEQLVEPYSKLAIIYDEIMAHVDYETWAKYISKIIKKWHPRATSLLDIACGTGNLLKKLSSYNYNLAGFDASFNMLSQAKQKFNSIENPIPLWVADIRNFALNYSTDIIICTYDSINYVHHLEECSDVFHCVSNVLTNHGLFIFDICTEKNSIKHFNNFYESYRGRNYRYSRRSSYDHNLKIHSNILKIEFFDSEMTFAEFHEQKIFKISELIEAIERTNFKLCAVLDDFTFRKANEKSLRAHFVLQKV